MALGAFVAGLLLAETEYRKAVEATIEPFKGLLLGVFFFTVGMSIDFRELVREPGLLLGGVVGLIAMKALVAVGLGPAVPPVMAGGGGDRPAARPGRRVRLRRHRHGQGRAGLVDAATASFALAVDLAHHGADAAALVIGARRLARG